MVGVTSSNLVGRTIYLSSRAINSIQIDLNTTKAPPTTLTLEILSFECSRPFNPGFNFSESRFPTGGEVITEGSKSTVISRSEVA